VKVQELLISEDNWTRHVLARNLENEPTFSNDSDAVCWCLVGAIAKCYGSNEPKRIKVINKVERSVKIGIAKWNGNRDRTFEDVKNLVLKLNI